MLAFSTLVVLAIRASLAAKNSYLGLRNHNAVGISIDLANVHFHTLIMKSVLELFADAFFRFLLVAYSLPLSNKVSRKRIS